MSEHSLNTIVVGGGVAGAEALLALHALAGDRVHLTLVSPGDELVLPALSVAEPFALGHVQRVSLTELVAHASAQLVTGSLVRVHDAQRRIELDDGRELAYDALLIAAGAQPVPRVDHATTWWPRGDQEAFAGLLRDLEEGYTRKVAFIIPPGAVWPLPLYELAMLTARQVASMGVSDVELTVITPEAAPLSLFGPAAAVALREELAAAGVALETAKVARVQRGAELEIILQPTTRRLVVQRIVALPGVQGPAIPGTDHDDHGFIRVSATGQMVGSESVWAAGDAIAYPVKYGGLSTQQADTAAAAIAAAAGAQVDPPERPTLRGVLMTGRAPRPLTTASATGEAGGETAGPLWRPVGKVFGTYLTPFLRRSDAEAAPPDEGIAVAETLPAPAADSSETFHALWSPDQGSGDYLRRLGHEIADYERHHEQAGRILHDHGELRRG